LSWQCYYNDLSRIQVSQSWNGTIYCISTLLYSTLKVRLI